MARNLRTWCSAAGRSPVTTAQRARLPAMLCGAMVAATLVCGTQNAAADEGGIGFWVPGLFGSLAATPGQPGWAWSTIYYHSSVAAQGGQTFQLGGLGGLSIVAGLNGQADLVFLGPTYTFATPVLGGQAAVSLFGAGGRDQASISATLTGPLGNTISGSNSQALTSFADVIPQVTLKWNAGVHNYMVYATGDIPVGDYDPTRLVNTGLGHGAIDGGFGYTYLNPQTGIEASAVLGFTYNFENPDTQYKNGIDSHLDFAVSKFLTKQLHIGMVGYVFDQITGDSGVGAQLGSFQSRVAGLGPQIGYLFPVGDMQGYINAKAYKDFGAVNRPEGFNVWFTFAISPAAPEKGAPPVKGPYTK